jgi:hypothetical protein
MPESNHNIPAHCFRPIWECAWSPLISSASIRAAKSSKVCTSESFQCHYHIMNIWISQFKRKQSHAQWSSKATDAWNCLYMSMIARSISYMGSLAAAIFKTERFFNVCSTFWRRLRCWVDDRGFNFPWQNARSTEWQYSSNDLKRINIELNTYSRIPSLATCCFVYNKEKTRDKHVKFKSYRCLQNRWCQI